MFCNPKPNDGNKPSAKSSNAILRWGTRAGLAFLGVHSLCILGGLTGVGVGIHHFFHHSADADSSRGIQIDRPSKIPTEYDFFSEARNAKAANVLLRIEPKFKDIIAAKQKEAGDEKIEVVFIEDQKTGDAHVVICKLGAMCPCSKPQVYDLGNKADYPNKEKYPGQRQVLNALYKEE